MKLSCLIAGIQALIRLMALLLSKIVSIFCGNFEKLCHDCLIFVRRTNESFIFFRFTFEVESPGHLAKDNLLRL
jgi:hypothetical protein